MMTELGRRARAACRRMAGAPTERKNAALHALAAALAAERDAILAANHADLEAARAAGLAPPLVDRLRLDRESVAAIGDGVRRLAELPDPVGETFDAALLPNGLRVHKQRVPLGTLGVIYESRPEVTVDIAALAIKTGNAVILRGGSETLGSNRALAGIARKSAADAGLPADAIQLVDSPDRALVLELLRLSDYVDAIIPRGGPELHAFCREHARVPVITGGIGICHLFVDASADLEAALRVVHNAKVQRPSVCNALDTVLVHRGVAAEFLPRAVAALREAGVSFRADESALAFVREQERHLPDGVTPAGPRDFDTEWLSLVLGLKVVESLEDAIEHIAEHGSGHSDGILTRDDASAKRFVAEVDSAAVFVNASTRFNDGGQLGLGAEAAVSTQRLHVRGPMGLRELTTYKWVVVGDYHVRE